jgi:tetratricopeptide (TPR) repeat protein
MNFKLTNLIALLLCLLIAPMAVADEDWTEDVEAAIKTAADDGKDLLVLYTGSDWCPPCKKLEEEILSQEDFLKEISPDFVLVKLDFPQNIVQTPELVAQNKAWREKFGIDGYPTIVLLDAKQRPYGITGYEEGGVEGYLGLLEGLRQSRMRRDDFLKEAEKAEGLERATLLDQGLSEVNRELVEIYYEDIVKEIVEIDNEDELGLRTKWNEAKDSEIRKIILTDIMMIARLEKPEQALAFIDEIVKEIDFPADQTLQIMQTKLNILQKLKRTDEVNAILDEMIEMKGVEGTVRERMIVKKVLLMVGNGQRDQAMQMLEESLAEGGDNLFMWLAKGELHDSVGKYAEAVEAYNQAIPKAGFNPDLLADLYGAKADALFELDKGPEALQLLDNFADDKQMPSDLRSEVLLHKAMILRDQGRRRLAILAENRAVEIADSASLKTEMQKVVDKLRKRYEKDE